MARTPAEIVAGARTIAVVGASPKPHWPGHGVMRYLLEQGYDVIPVRPAGCDAVLGIPCARTLAEIERRIDLVDVFRRPDACPNVARDAARRAPRTWLQLGIVSAEAPDRGRGRARLRRERVHEDRRPACGLSRLRTVCCLADPVQRPPAVSQTITRTTATASVAKIAIAVRMIASVVPDSPSPPPREAVKLLACGWDELDLMLDRSGQMPLGVLRVVPMATNLTAGRLRSPP